MFSILFADDPRVFMEHTNLDHLSDMLNIELNKLSIWLASNKLTLNIDKSHFVIFHRARLKENNVNISLCDISLNRVTFTKFLGIIIDDKLSFSRHISYMLSLVYGVSHIVHYCVYTHTVSHTSTTMLSDYDDYTLYFCRNFVNIFLIYPYCHFLLSPHL